METIYIGGNDSDYVIFIKSLGDKAQLEVVEEKFRWVIEREDGIKYIARPVSGQEI